jgi:hypothetical protein
MWSFHVKIDIKFNMDQYNYQMDFKFYKVQFFIVIVEDQQKKQKKNIYIINKYFLYAYLTVKNNYNNLKDNNLSLKKFKIKKSF